MDPPSASEPTHPPCGITITTDGVRFTISSRHATRIWLMLFDQANHANPVKEIELNPEEHRDGHRWSILVPEARAGQFYLYRMDGQPPEGQINCFDPDQWLLDPCALAISGSPQWGDRYHQVPGSPPKNGPFFPKGFILQDEFDWSRDKKPNTPLQDSILYEMHVRGYTAAPNSGVLHPGSYRGVIEKIPYLKKIGITAVELLPIHEFNEMEYVIENGAREGLRNFWGYSTLGFFAPNARYAWNGHPGRQVHEFKELVLAIHQAGIEVILDVVFNHTLEGGTRGPTYSFKGIDNSVYYMMEEDGHTYRNFSGCGNTLNCNHPDVQEFILQSLRTWVEEFHIDGFRFDLASIFTRGEDGEVLTDPPIVKRITGDPVLSTVKLIAEAWDAAGLYQVGSFPSPHWSEWNGRFRDDVRAYWKGEPHKIEAFKSGMAGSPELYGKEEQTALKTINYVSCHDGFTLRDIVSYEHKHNEANMEENRDGEDHNHSSNYGVEGPTDDPEINAVRLRQQKNLLASVLLSRGVPMLLAGDEFGHSQGGNNNAYCQDNERSWLDWDNLDEFSGLHDFVKKVIGFRKKQILLRQVKYPDQKSCPYKDKWFGPDEENHQAVAWMVAPKSNNVAIRKFSTILMLFNAGIEPATFTLPSPKGGGWEITLTTQDRKPRIAKTRGTLTVEGRSTHVLVSNPD